MKNARPNIIFILADDLGWGDPGCNNPESRVPMPNLNRMAENGVRFTNAHAPSSVCTPSRYGLLTGRYAWRTRLKEGVFYGYCRHLIDPQRTTLASLLRSRGYTTACIGKWHVGMDWVPLEGDAGDWPEGTAVRGRTGHEIGRRVDFTQPVRNGPNSVGFDLFFGTAACSTCNSPYVFIENDRPIRRPVWMKKEGVAGTPVFMDPDWVHETVDDTYAERAAAFVENQVKSRPDDPFFLYLALSAPHAPWRAAAAAVGGSGDGPRGDMCVWVDQSIGKVCDTLERLGIEDNTLLIFSSDNGAPVSSADRPLMTGRWSNHRENGPYRGYKTDIWDGGSRIPLIARWPNQIPAGILTDVEFCLTDVLATFGSLTGVELPEDAGEDSFDLLPAFFGEAPPRQRDNLITHSYTGVYSIRIDNWKLILDTRGSGGDRAVTPDWEEVVPGSPGQLYDLSEDPYETVNLWDDRREMILRLTYRIQQYKATGRSR